jgi:hypothetical protein
VEGIFRKNGNIKNLHTLQEKADKDLGSIDLSKENAVQLAALLKKFLRDLPEPLLTFKLYKLFLIALSNFYRLLYVETQNLDHRKKILHFCCCLLPKPNRDLLEVILDFLRVVASFAGGDSGNKMDVNNLATVIAPNILYTKTRTSFGASSTSAKDDSFLAIEVVKALIIHQDDFWTVFFKLFMF